MKACIGPSGKLLCIWHDKKIMERIYGNIPYIFDYWGDPYTEELHGQVSNKKLCGIRMFLSTGMVNPLNKEFFILSLTHLSKS